MESNNCKNCQNCNCDKDNTSKLRTTNISKLDEEKITAYMSKVARELQNHGDIFNQNKTSIR